ncbi:putative phosphatidylinositol glycan anchor biosynthesis class U protein-like [Apostichopus japonicus]|uniref:Putative phosphatidylinositol glycan anchor biosynthesis class U protein-like n=1 Tax=Stichopus japonicus TaxID=307972 RepID=A0A2G8LR18_STIJA|nr:putative phosphatidylinositol glycan anchor biosynthesis class U protein-like [Apostichopus japonicus]
MAAPIILTTVLGTLARIIILGSRYTQTLADRIELSTPVTSWKLMTEGVFLLDHGISPYEGDNFHQPPLLLYLFFVIHKTAPSLIPLVFLFLDLTTAFLLYLLNPFSILTCAAQSTSIINNLMIASTFLLTLKGQRISATLTLALASYQSLYPVMLIVPSAMHLAFLKMQERKETISYSSRTAVSAILFTVGSFLIWYFILLGVSYTMLESWDFVRSTYGFTLSVTDLKPNLGLFWYYFMEMFEHFRIFFLWVFQVHAFIYTLPLAIVLWKCPSFVFFCQLILMAVFKSYPSLGDTTVYFALLPVWSHAFHYLRNGLVISVMIVISVVLAPVLWHLWIYAGSANANFLFAFTLIYSTAQIFLVTDLIFAFLRRSFSLQHGMKALKPDGTEKLVKLQ